MMIPWRELVSLDAFGEFGDRVRERIGDGPTFLTFDIDFVDAAFAPGTGTPEVGGPTSFQAISYLRALSDVSFVGFDVVDFSSIYDGPGQITALLGANLIFDMLAMVACRILTVLLEGSSALFKRKSSGEMLFCGSL